MLEPVLQIKDVIFQNIEYPSFEIQKGNMVVFYGESGSGKSTLFKLLNATETVSAGEILYYGQPLEFQPTLELRKKILLVSQMVYLFGGSIADNFRIFYEYREEALPSLEKMRKYLSACCIDFPPDTSCVNLSGGERQRVFVAIGLSFLPDVLILDEPTAALDEWTATCLIENVSKVCKEKGITLLVITHDLHTVEKFADVKIELQKARRS